MAVNNSEDGLRVRQVGATLENSPSARSFNAKANNPYVHGKLTKAVGLQKENREGAELEPSEEYGEPLGER